MWHNRIHNKMNIWGVNQTENVLVVFMVLFLRFLFKLFEILTFYSEQHSEAGINNVCQGADACSRFNDPIRAVVHK